MSAVTEEVAVESIASLAPRLVGHNRRIRRSILNQGASPEKVAQLVEEEIAGAAKFRAKQKAFVKAAKAARATKKATTSGKK